MTNNIDSDITAWEHNIYKCDQCKYYWTVSFPVRGEVTIITEEDLYCGKCRSIGRVVQTKKTPTLMGHIKNAT